MLILSQYTKHTHGACDDAEDAEEVFDKHHEFLILQMLHDREGVDWPVTPIYAHFRDKFPVPRAYISCNLYLPLLTSSSRMNFRGSKQ